MKRLLQQFKNLQWNGQSAKMSVRIANYVLAFAILAGFWVAGQATRSPGQDAYASILQVAKLPIWLTMASNNNNVSCDDLWNQLNNTRSQLDAKNDELATKSEQMEQLCGDPPCGSEKQAALNAADDAWNASHDLSIAIAALIAYPSPVTWSNYLRALVELEAALEDLKAAIFTYKACMTKCQSIIDEVENVRKDIEDLIDDFEQINLDLTAYSCI